MERIIQRFEAKTADGRPVQLVIWQNFIESSSREGTTVLPGMVTPSVKTSTFGSSNRRLPVRCFQAEVHRVIVC